MLLAEALTRLLCLWDIGRLNHIPDLLLRERIPVILAQILNQTLFSQTTNGGWGSEYSFETTAYGLLTLKTMVSIPWHGLLHESIMSAIRAGEHLLSQAESDWAKPTHVWIGKVMYGSSTLSEAYCLAAMNRRPKPLHEWSHKIANMVDLPEPMVRRLVNFFSTLESFQNEPMWKIKASAVEAVMFLPQLKSTKVDIFPRPKEAKDEYLVFLAFTWVSVNNIHSLDLQADLLLTMMVHSASLNHLDEYMDGALASFSEAELGQYKHIIHDLCAPKLSEDTPQKEQRPDISATTSGSNHSLCDNARVGTDERPTTVDRPEALTAEVIATEGNEKDTVASPDNFRAVIGHYIRAILTNPGILDASVADRSYLQYALCTQLLAHLQQIPDNSRFSTQTSWSSSTTSVLARPRTSFYNWAHTTGPTQPAPTALLAAWSLHSSPA